MPEEVSGPTCPRCGEQNPAGARFCHRCGLSLAAPPASPSSEAAPAPSPPAGKKVCAACRTLNEPASTYCYKCGVRLPEQVLPVVVPGVKAGFWVRLPAFIIDTFLADSASLLIYIAWTGGKGIESALLANFTWQGNWEYNSLNTIITVTYFTITTGRWGRTLGKRILGLKVVRPDGSPISYWRSLGRYWAYFPGFLALGLGFLWVAFNSEKRGWHDFICDTRVVKG